MTPRVVLFGPMGIGKTTAIRALCGDALVDGDVPNFDVQTHEKATTTVGAEMGVVRISPNEELHVYGSPGQDRFGFLRQWLLSFAVGALVLVDINDPQALEYAQEMITDITQHAPEAAALVLSARAVDPQAQDRFSRELADRVGVAIPVLPVDVRDQRQMFEVLELLVTMLPES